LKGPTKFTEIGIFGLEKSCNPGSKARCWQLASHFRLFRFVSDFLSACILAAFIYPDNNVQGWLLFANHRFCYQFAWEEMKGI
jgi:hypothetical protein